MLVLPCLTLADDHECARENLQQRPIGAAEGDSRRIRLEPRCEVDIESVGKGIMLTPHPKRSRRVYALDEVAGMLKYDGQPVSVEDMNRAIEKEAIRMWNAKRR